MTPARAELAAYRRGLVEELLAVATPIPRRLEALRLLRDAAELDAVLRAREAGPLEPFGLPEVD